LDRVQWWIGDERCVPPTHEQSNERMIRKCFGARFVAGGNVLHSWHTSANWEECAIAYGRKMKANLGRPAVFDLILLGLGTDGHTASLFPGTKALEETHHNAVCNEVPQLQTMRLTMTYPVLNAGRAVWFLISGADKAPMVERLGRQDPLIPAGCLQNPHQTIYWQA
jgi:6-phosphogluconolactonase